MLEQKNKIELFINGWWSSFCGKIKTSRVTKITKYYLQTTDLLINYIRFDLSFFYQHLLKQIMMSFKHTSNLILCCFECQFYLHTIRHKENWSVLKRFREWKMKLLPHSCDQLECNGILYWLGIQIIYSNSRIYIQEPRGWTC